MGWAAGGEVRYTDKHQLIYTTAGHMVRVLSSQFKEGRYLHRKGRPFVDILVVDEAHSGSLDNSEVMELWDIGYKDGGAVPRLVVVSATPSRWGPPHFPMHPH